LKEKLMKSTLRGLVLLAALSGSIGVAHAGRYADTIALFKNAGSSAAYFQSSYGYAVFPNIGKAGFVVGGEYGKGHVYSHGRWIGNTSVTQVSVGFQAGGQDFSQIIFFQDRRALDAFTSGNFEFGADASAVAITAAASAGASTSGGPQASVSGGMKDAATTGEYRNGVAVFTIAKGGLMYEAAIAGEKFSYKPRETAAAGQ